MTPTIRQVIRCYALVAAAERIKCGRPGAAAARNAIGGTRRLCRAAGLDLDRPVTALTHRTLDLALSTLLARGVSRITAWSYVMQLRSLFARWALVRYRDAGWEVPPPDLPVFRAPAPHYRRPGAATLARVKRWYARLSWEHWFAATMMLEFAMRNGDVLRLGDDNFQTRDGGVFLCYTPHKTALSSGRRVVWPVHADIWRRILACGGAAAFDVTDETFRDLNRDLRRLGFRGAKASYELRKICIDHIYQAYGAEMAMSISGDDIRTLTRYYADPSQPHVKARRVLDLL